MYTLDIKLILDLLLSISLYFAVSTLGAFTKDMYNSLVKKDEVIRIKRIMVGSIFSTILLIGLEDVLLKGKSINVILVIAFILGGVGFELFGKWVTTENVERIIGKLFR